MRILGIKEGIVDSLWLCGFSSFHVFQHLHHCERGTEAKHEHSGNHGTHETAPQPLPSRALAIVFAVRLF